MVKIYPIIFWRSGTKSRSRFQFPPQVREEEFDVVVILAERFGLGLDDEWHNIWKKEIVMTEISKKTITLPSSEHGFPFQMPSIAATEVLAHLD